MILTPSLSAFLLSLLLTPVAIFFARRTSLVDAPDGSGLKIHPMPIPITGGFSIATALFSSMLAFTYSTHTATREIYLITIGSLAALALGMVDDLRGLKPTVRLLTQTVLGGGLVAAGFSVDLFPAPWLNSGLTVLLVIGAINSMNLLDGMDGLAAGVAAVCCTAFAIVSYARGDFLLFTLSSTMLAGFLGFLPYNFHPATIFLGNGGSCLTGFLLAVLMVLLAARSPSPAGLAGALLIVGLPIADTAYAIVRRIKAGRGIMSGDRDHFYDKLLRRGFSQRQSALIGYSAASIFAASGVLVLLAFE